MSVLEKTKPVLAALRDQPQLADTAFHEAVRSGDYGKVVVLLSDNPDLATSPGKDGWMPLHLAVQNNHQEIVQLLLAKGVDASAKNSVGVTPLHLASRPDIAELLLAKGADVNARQIFGGTPLLFASRENRTDIVKLLRRHGGHE